MIHVTVRVYATLRRFLPDGGSQESYPLEMAPGTTVAGLVAHLGLPAQEVKVVFINYRSVPPEHVLADGDRVGIFPLVAGG